MNRVEELINTLSDEKVASRSYRAKMNHTCKICSKPARSFRTPFSELEYKISSICQECQDYYYLIAEPSENA
jgi:hypothetical protein